jgi:hypothetical protein
VTTDATTAASCTIGVERLRPGMPLVADIVNAGLSERWVSLLIGTDVLASGIGPRPPLPSVVERYGPDVRSRLLN